MDFLANSGFAISKWALRNIQSAYDINMARRQRRNPDKVAQSERALSGAIWRTLPSIQPDQEAEQEAARAALTLIRDAEPTADRKDEP